MLSYRASALFFCLTNVLLVFKGASSHETQAQTPDVTKKDHQRNVGKTENDGNILKNILPLVTFDCLGKSGYFADKKFACEVFHYCDPDGTRSTFHCPRNFFFNSDLMVCELISENKRSLCWKKEDGDHKDKKILNKSITYAKHKISESIKKKSVGKSSSVPVETDGDDLDQVSSDMAVSRTNRIHSMDGIMTLEDVLSYMNADDDDSEHPKTFISTFLKMSGDRSAKALVNTSIINPFKKMKDHASARRNQQDVEIRKTSSKEGKPEKDLPTETSDGHEIKPRKRKRGRRGRMLTSESSWSKFSGGRHHSHVSPRSPADNPDQDDHMEEKQSYGLWEDRITSTENYPSSGSLRLFDIESRRNSTDPWRKRRRYYRRRRKHKGQSSLPIYDENSQDNTTDVYDHTTVRFQQSHGRKSRKLGAPEWQRSVPSSEAAKPQSPPLNTDAFQVSFSRDVNHPADHNFQHTARNRSHGFSEASANGNTEGKPSDDSDRNPWFKSTHPTEEDNYNLRFGERTTAAGTGIAPEPYYGDENGSTVRSHFFNFEEKPDGNVNQNSKKSFLPDESTRKGPKQKQVNDRRAGSSRKANVKTPERRPVDEEQTYSIWNLEDAKEKQKNVFDGDFSPSRDEVKDLTPHQKQKPEWDNKWSPMASEVTTLPPTVPLKSAFPENYNPDIPALVEDDDDVRWKQSEPSERHVKTKVPVGSSYKRWKEVPKVHTQRDRIFNVTPPVGKHTYEVKPVPQPLRYMHRDRRKEWPKHTMAHQHLSKVMNDFLSIPPRNLGLPKVSPMASAVPFQTYVPKYRIPNEDIYVAESIAKDVVKNQPDIYDIVDLISKNSGSKLKETTKPSNPRVEDHRLTIKDALLSMKSMGGNKEKMPSSDIDISSLRETLKDFFTAGVDKINEKDHSEEYVHVNEAPRIIKGSIRKLAELSKEEQEELKQITQIAKFTSLRLKPLFSSVLRDSSKEESSDFKVTAETKPSRATLLTAKKIPLRVLYSDDGSTSKEAATKLVTLRPAVKVIRNRQQIPRFHTGRRPMPVPPANAPFMILHPPSLRPPHPPPLQRNHAFPVMQMPHAGIRPAMYHQRHSYIPRRRKRSPQILRQLGIRRWNHNPFNHGVVQPFSSNFGSPLFRRPFTPPRFPIRNLPTPFRFPYAALTGNTGIMSQRKPRLRKPVFLPRQPVRNIPQHAHQTVIIEEVPIPIPVEVPDLSPQRVPVRNPIRTAGTVRAQLSPHLKNQRGQSTTHAKLAHFHHPPFPFGVGVHEPSTKPRPAPGAYNQPTMPNQRIILTNAVREPKLQFSLPVSQSPVGSFPQSINPNSNRNSPNRAVKLKPPVILTPAEFNNRPHPPRFAFPIDTKNLHLNSYPNFPYFQSGPPTSFAHFLSPENEKKPRNPNVGNSNNKPSKPPVEPRRRPSSHRPGKVFDVKYRETGIRVSTPTSVGVTSSPGGLFVVSPPDSSTFSQHTAKYNQNTQNEPSTKYNWSEESTESSENGVSNQRPKLGNGSSSTERKNRRRRPGTRRRRPRPNSAQGVHNSTTETIKQTEIKPSLNIWRTSNPPQQIPPPPSEITGDPFNYNIPNEEQKNPIDNLSINIPNNSGLNDSDIRSAFPPAGYYGSEQLSQILETSFSGLGPSVNAATSSDSLAEVKSSTFTITEPTEEYNLFSQEEAAFYDDEGGVYGGVPFGTRLKNKPRSRVNSRQNTPQNPTRQISNIQSGSPSLERYHANRGASYHEPGSQSSDVRDSVQPPRRRKPERLRYTGPHVRPSKPNEVRGIRPEVIYYDTREHPEGLFKIESDLHDSKPPAAVLMRNHPGTRDIFHLPNPYVDRDLFGMHPPTSKPVSSSGLYGVPPPRSPPREKKRDFVVPRRPQMDHASGGNLAASKAPARAPSFRQGENAQNQYRVRERKRPTAQPKFKSEVRTSSSIPDTTTARPHLYSTQVEHKPEEFQKPPEYPYYKHKDESSVTPKDIVTQRWTVKTTTTPARFTVPYSFSEDKIATTTMANLEIRTTVDKSSGFLPVRGIPKSIQGAKLDLHKINASISTSVSVSSSTSGGNHVSSVETSAEGKPKKVFYSKNGGLAVVRKGPRQRKRNRNRQRTTVIPKIENTSSNENGLNDHEKLQIAASIQDIIKATSETELFQGTAPPVTEEANLTTVSTKVSKKWILPPPEDVSQTKKIT